ncbi:MAG TPA: hypothetical protein VK052_00915 [Zeimonas sp.]|jgi:hypothetical protein|nr:hypothetical protein [Zeimonas sp.]
MIRASTLHRIGEIVMVAGIIFLCQPWNLFLHRYGLTVIIVGLLLFMFTGWFGNLDKEQKTDRVFDVSDHHEGKA